MDSSKQNFDHDDKSSIFEPNLTSGYSKEIIESVESLNNFTSNLQGKLGTMLKAQQGEFVNSYKVHMAKVRDELLTMEKAIAGYEEKIKYYENEGRLSTLIKRINFLESEQKNLFKIIFDKDKTIKELKSLLSIQEKQQKSLGQKYKQAIRSNFTHEIVRQQQHLESQSKTSKRSESQYCSIAPLESKRKAEMESINTFSTEVPMTSQAVQYRQRKAYHQSLARSRSSNGKLLKNEHSLLNRSEHLVNLDQKIPNTSRVQSSELDRVKMKLFNLEKENAALKMQNKKLLMFNSKYASSLSDLGEFFIKSTEELKKAILVKKKLSRVSLEDFKKEDKIVLLSHLLSNEEAITVLYNKIFKPELLKKSGRVRSVLEKNHLASEASVNLQSEPTIQQIILKNPQKQSSDQIHFPNIKSRRLLF